MEKNLKNEKCIISCFKLFINVTFFLDVRLFFDIFVIFNINYHIYIIN